MKRQACFVFHGSRITSHGSQCEEGRRPHSPYDWVRGRPPDASLPFPFLGSVRKQASAYWFSLRAIQATAAESRLRGHARIEACRHSSTVRRARNVRSGASHSHWERVLRIHAEIGRACRPPTTQTLPRNSDSRILDEYLEPWHASMPCAARIKTLRCRSRNHFPTRPHQS